GSRAMRTLCGAEGAGPEGSHEVPGDVFRRLSAKADKIGHCPFDAETLISSQGVEVAGGEVPGMGSTPWLRSSWLGRERWHASCFSWRSMARSRLARAMQRGVTLAEMIAVVAIVSVLSVLAVYGVRKYV